MGYFCTVRGDTQLEKGFFFQRLIRNPTVIEIYKDCPFRRDNESYIWVTQPNGNEELQMMLKDNGSDSNNYYKYFTTPNGLVELTAELKPEEFLPLPITTTLEGQCIKTSRANCNIVDSPTQIRQRTLVIGAVALSLLGSVALYKLNK